MVRCLTASSDDLPSIRARLSLIPGISSCRALALRAFSSSQQILIPHPLAQRKDLIHNV